MQHRRRCSSAGAFVALIGLYVVYIVARVIAGIVANVQAKKRWAMPGGNARHLLAPPPRPQLASSPP